MFNAYNGLVKKLALLFVLLGLVPLTACGADPEAGVPLKLAEQVSAQAFKRMDPAVLVWASLMPEDYVPSYQDFPWAVEDGEAMMQQTLQDTPLVDELDGETVRVSGYVVPLAGDETAVTEFLLVPFLGACVHVPPPPANQIVYVKPTYPLLNDESWDVVSVTGVISAKGRTSEYGAAGYEMVGAMLSAFDEEEYFGVEEAPIVIDEVPDPLDFPAEEY